MLLRSVCTSLQDVKSQKRAILPNFMYYYLIQDAKYYMYFVPLFEVVFEIKNSFLNMRSETPVRKQIYS
jgi:hypothetical protein